MGSGIVVFSGPTISAEEIRRTLDAKVLGPAKRGDVLSVVYEHPAAILLIDGYFNSVPSVWHKEILWAMNQGIRVFGASSMGALRAAELTQFGMTGIGEIFEAYRSGALEDDDEVAVAHGDETTGYRCVSEAMINIRFTLREAESAGVLDEQARLYLENRIKSVPFPQRSLRATMGACETERSGLQLSALREWLPQGWVDQKRVDARTALGYVAKLAKEGWEEPSCRHSIAETDGWGALKREIESLINNESGPASILLEDELRSRGKLGRTLLAATARFLAEERLRTAHAALNARATEAWIEDFRRENDLCAPATFDAWIAKAGLREAELTTFFEREAVFRATKAAMRARVGCALQDELRSTGTLPELLASAHDKQQILAQRGLSAPTLQDTGLEESELWQWFFSSQLGIAAPESVAAYAARECSTVQELRDAALRAYVFQQLSNAC